MMGVAWHGNYFRYFEVARETLLNQFSHGYRRMKESDYLWPAVDAQMKYRRALTFEQRIRVRVHIKGFESRLRAGHQIFDAETGKRVTTGYAIQIVVDEQNRELYFISPGILFEHMGVKP